jgi:ATP-dependent DNA helicase RecG
VSLLSFDELFDKLRTLDEAVEIEAKRAEEVGKSVLETVSAFCNEPGRGGGYLVLGVALGPDALFGDYRVVGVPNPEKLQQELATRCREAFNVPVRPQITVERRNGKFVVVVYVAEVQNHEKPVYLVSRGLPQGAFRRIGSTDQHCTDDDLALFYQSREHRAFDDTVIPDTSLDDFDPNAIAEYRRTRAELNPNAAELGYNDEELLYALAATGKHEGTTCATIAGLMLFGKQSALRRHFPMTRVDYILVEGREWVPNPEERYQGVEMREALMTLVPRVVGHVLGDVPKAFTLGENGLHRREVPLVPRTVIREAVVNALIHRSYRQHQPVQIIRYSNRIEIRNPGHSLKPDDRLGEPGSVARNPKIAAAIHEAGLAETKGTGIRAMRDAMANANLTAPFFESNRETDTFTATLLVHHLFGQDDIAWLAQFNDCHLSSEDARALVVVREVGAMNNAYYRALTGLDTLTASKRLQRLRDLRLLEQKGKGAQTYYIPGERFLASLSPPPTSPTDDSPDKSLPGELDLPDKPLSGRLAKLPGGFPMLPPDLAQQIEPLGRRAQPGELYTAILALCAWRPLRAFEIATLIGRNTRHVQEAYLSSMIREGNLEYTHPENPAHRQQAYRTTPQGKQLIQPDG